MERPDDLGERTRYPVEGSARHHLDTDIGFAGAHILGALQCGEPAIQGLAVGVCSVISYLVLARGHPPQAGRWAHRFGSSGVLGMLLAMGQIRLADVPAPRFAVYMGLLFPLAFALRRIRWDRALRKLLSDEIVPSLPALAEDFADRRRRADEYGEEMKQINRQMLGLTRLVTVLTIVTVILTFVGVGLTIAG